MNYSFCFNAILVISLLGALQTSGSNHKLPFDCTNPVIYDNDDHRDMYTDEYLLSLASAGDIVLKEIITTYSANKMEYDLFVEGRQQIIQKARKSGFINLPDAIAGPYISLQRPETNCIEDTETLNSVGGRVIVEEALKATSAKPLVIITGGQLTAIADAYLQNPDIVNSVIVCGIFGVKEKTYNANLDAWAWIIVVSKFKCVSISDSDNNTIYSKVFQSERPQTFKQRFKEDLRNGTFPKTTFYDWIIEKRHPVHPVAYMEWDGDTPAAIPLMRPDYINNIERWRCIGIENGGMPKLVRDNDGPLYLVVSANSTVATKEFWRAIENIKSREH